MPLLRGVEVRPGPLFLTVLDQRFTERELRGNGIFVLRAELGHGLLRCFFEHLRSLLVFTQAGQTDPHRCQ